MPTRPAAGGHGLAEARVHRAVGVPLQQAAVHVAGPARHRCAHQQVLARGLVHEPHRGDDRHLARRGVLGRQHTQHAAEVVHVAVGVDDRADRPVAEVPAREGQGGRSRLARGQRVDDDPAGAALHEREVREVEAAQLPHALGHLEQARLVVQLRLAPEARVDGGRGVALHEREAVEVPHHPAGVVAHLAAGPRDQAAAGGLEGARVGEVDAGADRGLAGEGGGGGARRRFGRRGGAARGGEGEEGQGEGQSSHGRSPKNPVQWGAGRRSSETHRPTAVAVATTSAAGPASHAATGTASSSARIPRV